MPNPNKEAITKDIEIARQLEAAFTVYVKDISPLVSHALANAWTKRWKNKKYEWFEYSREKFQISTGMMPIPHWAFDPLLWFQIQIDSTNILVWDTFRFETSAWISISDLTIYVTKVLTTGFIEVIKVGWTDAPIPGGSLMVFKSNLLPENSKKNKARKIRVPITKFNYFQIFDTMVENSRTIEGSDAYGDIGKIAHIRAEAFYDITRQLTEILANGIKIKFSDPVSWKEIYWAGWITEFVINTQDALWAIFTQNMFDDAVETILKWGWLANTIRCSIKQARAISALDKTKLLINLDEKVRWNVVTSLQAWIPVNGSKIETIIVDTTMQEDEIEVFDIRNIALIPYSNWAIREMDATEKWQDGQSIRMLWEYTVEAKNMNKTAVKITNLG